MRLTPMQLEMLRDAVHGRTMFDGNEARTASSLAAKGLVHLPAGHGHYFGSHVLKVTATDAGRRALTERSSK